MDLNIVLFMSFYGLSLVVHLGSAVDGKDEHGENEKAPFEICILVCINIFDTVCAFVLEANVYMN